MVEVEEKVGPVHQFNVFGASYRIDLNSDGIEEYLTPQKRDGVDWLEIRDHSERIIFQTKLLAMGGGSSIYKIKFVQISPTVKSLLVFLDEGITKGKKFESTGRFFVLTYENNNLEKIQVDLGPHLFHEKEALREQYFRRDSQVNIYDIDKDGVREIALQYNHIQRIMKFENGHWKRY